MNPIVKFFVAALLLTGSAAGIMAPAVNPAPAAAPAAVTTTAQTPTELTSQEAISIALEHAGLEQAEVTRLKTHREKEDGKQVWDVEFRHGDYEYDYTIHAQTGAILEWDKDYEPVKQAPTQPPATEPPATEPPATQPPVTEPPATETAKLTKEEALSIALKHAGLTEAEISRVKCEYDRDDGIPEWEVEFRVGKLEYEYTIHAETGAILEWEKDRDD